MEAAGTKAGTVQTSATSVETATAVAPQAEKKIVTNPEPKPKQPRQRTDDKWKVFSGTANDALATEVCEKLGLPLGQTHITKFL